MTSPIQQTAVLAERGGSTIAAGGGMMMWLSENHDAIAALGVIVGSVMAVAGFIVHWLYLHRGSKERRRRRDDA